VSVPEPPALADPDDELVPDPLDVPEVDELAPDVDENPVVPLLVHTPEPALVDMTRVYAPGEVEPVPTDEPRPMDGLLD
jgi:hypothetical protein